MQTVDFVVFPGVSVMELGVTAVFELANCLTGNEYYRMRFVSEAGGLVKTSAGVAIETETFIEDAVDTVIIGGGDVSIPPSAGMVTYIRRAADRSRRIASICTGAFVLAEAGLLDGRRASTHWYYARELQLRFPNVKVDADRIFSNDGAIWTSAGMTAGIDLALALIEDDLGAEVARIIARKLVVYHRRAGGQSQYSALLELEPKSDRIQLALDYAKRNLNTDLTVAALANAAHLSPRQFSRAFRTETGQSPAKAIEKLRVETARLMMEQSHHSIDVVARQTGFGDGDRMRRAFLRVFGQPPRVIRRNARAEVAGAQMPETHA
ncbi:AraC family transcriptional regulator [Hyphomicrobium methylovorum]|uniref:helix-turn-helix domain-containing protein n=1 Tax=Hyphomicrobium methylovorum TaxID=84 RepID=UPI0015E62E67|nr:AraC family transcriptional regulator [Hyphomicrobium methylovorum]